MRLGQGNAFKHVCHSVHGRGGLPPKRGLLKEGDGLQEGLPWKGRGLGKPIPTRKVGNTHPTGTLSCLKLFLERRKICTDLFTF